MHGCQRLCAAHRTDASIAEMGQAEEAQQNKNRNSALTPLRRRPDQLNPPMKKENRIRAKNSSAAVAKQSKTRLRYAYNPAEFKLVRLRECPINNPITDSPEAINSFWRNHIPSAPWFESDRECFCILLLNTRRRLIGFHMVGIGTTRHRSHSRSRDISRSHSGRCICDRNDTQSSVWRSATVGRRCQNYSRDG
jgi:hypothetical protein